MPGPDIVIAHCRIDYDAQKTNPLFAGCKYDRERTVNPDLQKGMECKPEVTFEVTKDKILFDYQMICRPIHNTPPLRGIYGRPLALQTKVQSLSQQYERGDLSILGIENSTRK